MNTSDSAEEFVKLYLDGVEHCIKIAGVGAKNIAMMLIAMSKEKTQTKGKTRLSNMLKTGKPLEIFTIGAKDLKKFSQEAKKYGILYCALANKKNSKIDGMVDIMVREEDSAKFARIAKRFNFRDVASIQKDLEKEKQEKQNTQENPEQIKSEEEQFIDDIMPVEKEEQKEIPSNDTKETEEKSQSEISSNIKLKDKTENFKDENKKSVKEELKEIEKELKEKEQAEEIPEVATESIKSKEKKKEPKHFKETKQKTKGKRYKEPKHLDNSRTVKRKKSKNKGRSK